MRSYKILITSLSGQLGGLELRLADEARFLTQLGYQTELAINNFPNNELWLEQLRNENIPFSFFSPAPFFEQWQWRRLNKIRSQLFSTAFLRHSKADLVHVAFAWTETGGTRLWLAHKAGIPTVISVHNAFPDHEFSPWHEAILYEAFQSVRGIYAVSDSALDNFLKVYNKFILPNTLQKVIYNPVDTTKFIPSVSNRMKARESIGFNDNDFVIGVVGRLSEQKRPEMLLEVFSVLKKQFSFLHLVFIGQGDLELLCRQQADKLKLSDSVHFLGFNQSVEKILPMLDLHVLLSRREGFGIATAEAMACGVPVVATDVPGSKDILAESEAGMLVSAENVVEITERLARLIADSDGRKIMSQKGPKEVEQRFSAHLIKQQLQGFYKKVLASCV